MWVLVLVPMLICTGCGRLSTSNLFPFLHDERLLDSITHFELSEVNTNFKAFRTSLWPLQMSLLQSCDLFIYFLSFRK